MAHLIDRLAEDENRNRRTRRGLARADRDNRSTLLAQSSWTKRPPRIDRSGPSGTAGRNQRFSLNPMSWIFWLLGFTIVERAKPKLR
jgi:hypothetical protein